MKKKIFFLFRSYFIILHNVNNIYIETLGKRMKEKEKEKSAHTTPNIHIWNE